MKTAALVQARMGSSRLPGKVLQDIAGRPLLARVVERASRARLLEAVIVATSTGNGDDPIAEWCAGNGVPCFRGSEDDVLARMVGAAREFDIDVVVRLTADCPLLDPEVVDRVVAAFFAGVCDYAANVLDLTFPDGLDTEVIRRDALERAHAEAVLPSDREHVTPYIRRNSGRFRQCGVSHDTDLSGLRWTVDEPRDLDVVRRIYEALGNGPFGMHDVLALFEERPELRAVNAGIVRNEGYILSLERDRAGGLVRRSP